MPLPSRALFPLLAVLVLTVPLAGCEAIGTIFQGGMWVGAVGVVLVLALVGFLFSRRPRV